MTVNLPSDEAPKPVAEAAEALHAAEQQLADARQRRQEAEGGLREAEVLDREALAARLAHDRDAKPSREHRDNAQAALDEAVEIEQACEANLSAATERAASAVLEHVGAWQQGIEAARVKSDREFSRAVAKLAESEQRRSMLRGVDAWLKQLQYSGRSWLVGGGSGGTVKATRGAQALPGQLDLRDPRNADARLSVAYALELLSGYAHESSVEGEREAEQRRLEAERQAEERQERMRQIHASAVQPL
jgi:hypothetical protein